MILFLASFIVSIAMALSADQIPPLPAHPGEKCHIAEARALLDKAKYSPDDHYALKILKTKPLTLVESVEMKNTGKVSVEQRGCEDVYFRFRIQSLSNGLSRVERLRNSMKAVQELKLNSKALLNLRQLREMANKVENSPDAGSTREEFVVCLMKIPGECITDVKVTLAKDAVELYYVDRP
jgi:hypothetical protein